MSWMSAAAICSGLGPVRHPSDSSMCTSMRISARFARTISAMRLLAGSPQQ